MRALLHVDDVSHWELLRSNALSLLELVPMADVVVVANGNAITGYLKASLQPFFGDERITFCACQNSMNSYQMVPAQLPPSVEVVPAGILALIHYQDEGYPYVKP